MALSGWYARRDNAPFVFTADETIPFLLAPSPLRFRKRLLERLPQAIDIKDIRLMDIDANSTKISLDNNQTKDIESFLRNFIAREIITRKVFARAVSDCEVKQSLGVTNYNPTLALPGGEGDGNETRRLSVHRSHRRTDLGRRFAIRQPFFSHSYWSNGPSLENTS